MRSILALDRIAVLALAALALSGCDALTGNKEKSFSFSLDDAAVAVGQGARDSVEITVTRSNFDQPVTFSVVGTLPTGVTASFSVNPVQGATTKTTLRFFATASATPGTATVTIRATGEGVAERGEPVDITVSVTGTYTISMLNSSVTLAQGGAGEATVLLTRTGGNQSSVTLTASGAPAGMGISVASPTAERGATVAITATASVPPGTYPITITGSAAGISPDQPTQLSVVVIPPPSTATISVPFCSSALPVWFAFRNEGFGWQRVTATGNSFTFAASQKTAIAYVHQFGNEFQTNVFIASRHELLGLSDRDCDGSKTLAGTVAGMTAGQTALVVMGANSASTTSASYTLQGVADRPLDLVATRGVLSSFEGFLSPDKMIVRRSLNLTSTIPELDFNSVEAFAPVSSNLSIAGFTTGFVVEFQNTLWSATATYGSIHSGSAAGGTTTLHSAPAAQLQTGDMHELLVDAFQSNGQVGHATVAYFGAPGDRTETLGPLLTEPTVNAPVSTPYARVRGQLASQSDYSSAVQFFFQQGAIGNRRIVVLVGTAAHFGATPTTWDLVVPDFSGTAGFTPSWMLTPGAPIVYFAQAFGGRDDLLFGALPTPGEFIKLAYRVQNSPVLVLRAMPSGRDVRSRRAPLVTQYLRR